MGITPKEATAAAAKMGYLSIKDRGKHDNATWLWQQYKKQKEPSSLLKYKYPTTVLAMHACGQEDVAKEKGRN